MMTNRNQTVNVERTAVIDALKKGLEEHKLQYAEAQKDYHQAVIKFLSNALNSAKDGDFSNLVLNIPKPENHEKDYLHILDMLELSVDDVITLDSDTFRAYFKGEWSWKHRFNDIMGSTKLYLES